MARFFDRVIFIKSCYFSLCRVNKSVFIFTEKSNSFHLIDIIPAASRTPVRYVSRFLIFGEMYPKYMVLNCSDMFVY